MTSLSHCDKRSIGQVLAAAGAHKRREACRRLSLGSWQRLRVWNSFETS